jgi:hypothetical protein
MAAIVTTALQLAPALEPDPESEPEPDPAPSPSVVVTSGTPIAESKKLCRSVISYTSITKSPYRVSNAPPPLPQRELLEYW